MKVYELKQYISAFDNYFKDDWNDADEMPNNYVEVIKLCNDLMMDDKEEVIVLNPPTIEATDLIEETKNTVGSD